MTITILDIGLCSSCFSDWTHMSWKAPFLNYLSLQVNSLKKEMAKYSSEQVYILFTRISFLCWDDTTAQLQAPSHTLLIRIAQTIPTKKYSSTTYLKATFLAITDYMKKHLWRKGLWRMVVILSSYLIHLLLCCSHLFISEVFICPYSVFDSW